MNTQKDTLLNYAAEIAQLKKAKNAVLMAHYYQRAEIQELADYVGDSLALAQQAAQTQANIIVLCGVHFMGETAKILCPDKKVLVPVLEAGCSLADSCQTKVLEQYLKQHPGYTVVSYVNTTAAVKALTDVVVTSSNAKKIIDSFPREEKILFGPDKNLGAYLNRVTGRKMQLWDGSCHVHDRFSLEGLLALKQQYPQAPVLVHPECRQEIALQADYVGSTTGILTYAKESIADTFIVVTESGIIYKMQQALPNKKLVAAPYHGSLYRGVGEVPSDNRCEYMRMNTLEQVYTCMKEETPAIEIEESLREKAVKPILRMLALSK